MPMHNPSHPGRILKLSLGDMDVTEAASRLNIARAVRTSARTSQSKCCVVLPDNEHSENGDAVKHRGGAAGAIARSTASAFG